MCRAENVRLLAVADFSGGQVLVRVRLNLLAVVLRIAVEDELTELTSFGLTLQPDGALVVGNDAEAFSLILPEAEFCRHCVSIAVTVGIDILHGNGLGVRGLLVVVDCNRSCGRLKRSIEVVVFLHCLQVYG